MSVKRIKCKVYNRGTKKDPKNYEIAGVEFRRCDQDKSIIQSTFVPEVHQNELNTNSWYRNSTMMSSFLELFVNTYEETKIGCHNIHNVPSPCSALLWCILGNKYYIHNWW